MNSCRDILLQKSYTIFDRGWLSDTLKSVSKKEFILHMRAKEESTFSINKIIKTLAVGILGAAQTLSSGTFSKSGMQITVPALTCHLWSQISVASAQTTSTTLMTPASTPAPGPQGDEFQVNTYTKNDQFGPSVAALTGGGFVVTWSSSGQDGSDTGIFGQRFDAAGVKAGSEFQVNTYTTGSQSGSSVSSLQGGGFVVTWTSWDRDGSRDGVFGQRFDAAGLKAGSEFQINTYKPGIDESSPCVTYLGGGGFVVSWEGRGDIYGIYGQRFDALGAKTEREFNVSTVYKYPQVAVSTSQLGSEGFVATWTNTARGIMAQRFESTGAKAGSEFQIDDDILVETSIGSDVASIAEKGYVLTWMSDDESNFGIYGKRLDTLGVKIGNSFQINTYTADTQSSPRVAVQKGGVFLVSWMSKGQDGSGYGIYGQRFDITGAKAASEFQVNTYTSGNQSFSRVAALSGGGFVVTWNSEGQDGSGDGVFGRIFREGSINPPQTTNTSQITLKTTPTNSLITQDAAPGSLDQNVVIAVAASVSVLAICLFSCLAFGGVQLWRKKMAKNHSKQDATAKGVPFGDITHSSPSAKPSGRNVNSTQSQSFGLNRPTQPFKNNSSENSHSGYLNDDQLQKMSEPNFGSKGYVTNPYNSQSSINNGYSDPNARLEELKRNPPAANYITHEELQAMNAQATL